ncbi:hypothetical protein AAII07_50220 [Microvirga sp. 0TCS3.31]
MMRDTAIHSKWNLESLAYIGALLGLLPAVTHQIYSISLRDFHGSEPLTHMMVELLGGMLSGSLLLYTIGWIRNQRVAEEERTVEKAVSKPEASSGPQVRITHYGT